MKIFHDKRKKICSVRMSFDEALKTIESLSGQIHRKNPNTGRYEATVASTEDGILFSISVMDEDTARMRNMLIELEEKMEKRAKKKGDWSVGAGEVLSAIHELRCHARLL